MEEECGGYKYRVHYSYSAILWARERGEKFEERGGEGKMATKARLRSRWLEENVKTMEKGPLGEGDEGATVGAKLEGRQGSDEAEVKEAGREGG